MEHSEKTMDKIVALCKNRGFVYPGSDIYGGLANSWDYGPLGVEFKNNVKKAWLKKFVQESPYNVGLDAAIIMNPQTWVTTGHVSSFSDPLLDCRACKARHRADKLIGTVHGEVNVDAMSFDEMDSFIAEHEDILCPVCGKHVFTPIRKFNMKRPFLAENTDWYRREIELTADVVAASGKLVEVNTGAISRGWQNDVYPSSVFRKLLRDRGVRFILSSDAHAADTIDCAFDRFGSAEEFVSGVSLT